MIACTIVSRNSDHVVEIPTTKSHLSHNISTIAVDDLYGNKICQDIYSIRIDMSIPKQSAFNTRRVDGIYFDF